MAVQENLEMARSFEAAGFNPPQAQALAHVTGHIEILASEMKEMRQDMRQDMREMRSEFNQRLDATNQNIQALGRHLIITMIAMQALFGGALITIFKLFFSE